MFLGYNTNGFAHHRLEDAIAILAEIGYRSVAITLDHYALNPFASDLNEQTESVRRLLRQYNLRSVIETGSRFLLDPRRKHWPTLLDPSEADRGRRRDFVMRAIDVAAALEADAVSFWSGAAPANTSESEAMNRLTEECGRIVKHAESCGVRLAFEPEPGMFIDTMARFAELHRRVNHPLFGLTLDVGHVHCMGDGLIEEHVTAWRDRLFNVHLEDMKRGVHEHLMFGEGEMDIAAVLAALKRINYDYSVNVELSRHSHNAVETARKTFEFLTQA